MGIVYKISGMVDDNARIIIVNENSWDIESNTSVSGVSYEIGLLADSKKLVLARKDGGEVFVYGNVTAIEYTAATDGYYPFNNITDGGTSFSWSKQIDKFNFSSETASTISDETSSYKTADCFSSTEKGYHVGGYYDGSRYRDVESLNFSNDAVSTVSDDLAEAKSGSASFNSETRGYTAGGYASGYSSNIEKLRFSDERITYLTNNLACPVISPVGFHNIEVCGYSCGGHAVSPCSGYQNKIEKVDFSTHNVSEISDTLSTRRRNGAGFESQISGYFAGGNNGGGGAELDEIDKMDFSTESVGAISATLQHDENGATACSSDEYSYINRGKYKFDGTNYWFSDIEKFNFSDDTISYNYSSLNGDHVASSTTRGMF